MPIFDQQRNESIVVEHCLPTYDPSFKTAAVILAATTFLPRLDLPDCSGANFHNSLADKKELVVACVQAV